MNMQIILPVSFHTTLEVWTSVFVVNEKIGTVNKK